MLGFGQLAGICASGSLFAFSSALIANPLYTLHLRGEVPTVCRAEIKNVQAINLAGDVIAQLDEFCNSAAGYSVYAVASDPALRISVDGRTLGAQADGRYLLSGSSEPALATRAISLSGAPGGTLSITVVAS